MAERDVLTETESRILALKIAEPQLTVTELAARLDMSRVRVSTLMNQNPLRRAIDDHLQDILESAKEHAISAIGKAFGTLIEIMDHGESDHARRLAARDLIMILQKRGDGSDVGEEIWEAAIGQYGQIRIERVKQVPGAAAGDDTEADLN